MDRLTFEDFYSVRWHVAERTYGNDHSTLIGLLVDWWVSRDATNSVLEGGPSCNPRRTGLMGRGHCDALFCRNAKPVGVLEVEGCGNPKAGDVEKKAIETAKKLGRFFASADDNYSQLKFGVLLLYRFRPQGRGASKLFRPATSGEVVNAVVGVSTAHPAKDIFVISLEKEHDATSREGIRARSKYYSGRLARIDIVPYNNGASSGQRTTLFPRSFGTGRCERATENRESA